MPRSRVIKPEFWDDEKLATNTSRDARLTFIGMWNHSDDYGVVKGHPSWLKNKIFPYDDIRLADFQKWLKELEGMRCIIPFEVDGEKFYYIRTFAKHQTINRPSQQRNASPPEWVTDGSVSPHGVLTDETETETETETEVKPKPNTPDEDSPILHLRYVYISRKEYGRLIEKVGQAKADELIERLDGYIGQIGAQKAAAKYKSHYDTMLNWHRKDQDKTGGNGTGPPPRMGTSKTAGNWAIVERMAREAQEKGAQDDGQ